MIFENRYIQVVEEKRKKHFLFSIYVHMYVRTQIENEYISETGQFRFWLRVVNCGALLWVAHRALNLRVDYI